MAHLRILHTGTQPLLLKLLSSQGIWSCALCQWQATVMLMGKSMAPGGNFKKQNKNKKPDPVHLAKKAKMELIQSHSNSLDSFA